jgi:hypothetical protein
MIWQKAALGYLCEGKEWTLSLKRFNEKLIDGGSIDKGPRGNYFRV